MNDTFVSAEKTKEFIDRFLGEHGDVAFATLIMNLHAEIESMKVVIGALIEDADIQKSLIRTQTKAAISMAETFVALKQRITELENKRKETVH